MASKGATPQWLTREQIDSVIQGMSAGDLVEAMGDGDKMAGPKMPVKAFDIAAARLGVSNGTTASAMVRLVDFKYLAKAIAEAVSIESPLSEGQEA